MKHKILRSALIIAFAVAAVGGLSACFFETEDGEHHHKGSLLNQEWTEPDSPTCTESGMGLYVCTECGETYRDTVPALGHEYHGDPDREPIPATCESDGMTYGRCIRCNIEKEWVTPATGHNYNDLDDGTPATCTETGIEPTKVCKACGKSLPGGVIPALGHDYSPETERCTRCGELPDYPVTVTFEMGDGNDIAPQTYTYGDTFVPPTPTHPKNYAFEGWYLNGEFTEPYTGGAIKADTTLYAKWLKSITISDKAGLLAIADDPTAAYTLSNDINLRGETLSPIENFSGILDGKGFTVKNFVLSSNEAGNNFGFIGVNEGTLRDLTFMDVTFNATAETTTDVNFGVIAAVNRGTISGCSVASGTINFTIAIRSSAQATTSSFGVIAGSNTGTISDCNASVDFSYRTTGKNLDRSVWDVNYIANFFTGGIAGHNRGGKVQTCHYAGKIDLQSEAIAYGDGVFGFFHNREQTENRIGGLIGAQTDGAECLNNYADAEIGCSSSYREFVHNNGTHQAGYDNMTIGGLVGWNDGKSVISSCFSMGKIVSCGYDGNLIGGLVAWNTADAKIGNSYSKTDIVLQPKPDAAKGYTVGGFVGENGSIIQNCYATGKLSSPAQSVVGGFAGKNLSTGSISKCYSTGNVSATSGNADFFVGESGGALFKCYYLKGASVQLGGEYVTGKSRFAEEQSYSDMWSEEFLVEELYWDEEGWIILLDEDPILDWEITVNHDYNKTVVEPTCTEFGYTIYVCRDCNRIFVRDFVAPLGHDYDYDHPQIVEPTCTTEGHTYYRCLRKGCDHLHEVATEPANGHTKSVEKESQPATCTEEGYINYHCNVCGNDFTEKLEPTGHRPHIKTGDERVEPTCRRVIDGEETTYETKPGHTARVTCETCGEVIEGSQTIEPHTFSIRQEGTKKPTCTEDGNDHLVCTLCGYTEDRVIPATGHTIIQGTAKCGVCGEFVVDEKTIVKIGTPADLQKISENLNGVYMLSKNIDLAAVEWTPIGTANRPFRGILFGNNFKITNLNLTEKQFGGLFAYNEGKIVELTIENAVISADIDKAVSGVFAAVNAGELVNCTLTGTVRLSARFSREVNGSNASAGSFSSVLGGMVGRNTLTGKIDGCTVSGTVSITFSHVLVNVTPIDLDFYLSRGWDLELCTSAANFSAGGVVGENNGAVTDCTVSGSVGVRNTQTIELERTVQGGILRDLTYKAGKLQIETDLYFGAIAGYNSGSVSWCNGKRATLEMFGTQDDSGNFFAMLHVLRTDWGEMGITGLVGCTQEGGETEGVSPI